MVKEKLKLLKVPISKEVMKLVDERRKNATEKNSMTWEQTNKKLKNKYGV